MTLSPADILDIIKRANESEWFEASVRSSKESYIRSGCSSLIASGQINSSQLSLISGFGARCAAVQRNITDRDSLLQTIKEAKWLAQQAHKDPEFVPTLKSPQPYLIPNEFDQDVEELSFEMARDLLNDSGLATNKSRQNNAIFLTWRVKSASFSNSEGISHQHRSTSLTFSMTSRSADGLCSAKIERASHKLADINFGQLISEVFSESEFQRLNPRAQLEPGAYTVILQPNAVASILGFYIGAMDKRQADEGRSYFSLPGGATRLGQKAFPEFISLSTDPCDPAIPSAPFNNRGEPLQKITWIDAGTICALPTTRYWAQKSNLAAIPAPVAATLHGSNDSLESLIQDTKNGILVQHLWYIRMVDPEKILVTGLTRDGTSLIEGGKVTRPLCNFRFNISPVEILANCSGLTQSQPAIGSEYETLRLSVPSLRTEKFRFTSISDAI